MCVVANRSRVAPPSMVHSPDSHWRSGDSEPFSEAWAVTAKIRPVSRARRLPLAASTSMRDEQPRARIMPIPNRTPPRSAPDRLPVAESWRACETSSQPSVMKTWVAVTAAAKAHSQMASFAVPCRFQNSTTAERMQKRERCANMPNNVPISKPATVTVAFSPRVSISLLRSIMPLVRYCYVVR